MPPAVIMDGIMDVLSDVAVGAADFNQDDRERGIIEVTLPTASGAQVSMYFTLYQDPVEPSIVHVVVLKTEV